MERATRSFLLVHRSEHCSLLLGALLLAAAAPRVFGCFVHRSAGHILEGGRRGAKASGGPGGEFAGLCHAIMPYPIRANRPGQHGSLPQVFRFDACALGPLIYTSPMVSRPKPVHVCFGRLLKQCNSPGSLGPGLCFASPQHQSRCVFELAAYLHSRPADKVKLIIRPTILGPVFVSFPVALFFFILVTGLIPTGQHAIMWPLMGLASYVGFYKSCS